jgi:N-dimethylarginine dimethylaminohydrolase
MRKRRILMCPPDFYGIEYEINPWMKVDHGSSPDRARQQWQGLYRLLLEAGATVELMTPVQGLPDLVFTANAGVVFHQKFFSSRFRHKVRAREEPVFDAWFSGQGFTVEHIPEGTYFEGAGDALFCGEKLFAGYRIRSDVRGHQWLGQVLGVQVLPVELVNPSFYHLDTCFCPLTAGEAIWYPPAFDAYGQKVIRANVPKLIAVNDVEANRFGCNAVVVGKRVVMNTGCEKLLADLIAAGYIPVATELDEFLKSGGSAKCLTLRLDGEEAATWAQQDERGAS